tara:strand:+ start:34 stop:768 length:735 start_codon:yes stop_codon:yes gene_type:complete
MKTLLIKLYLFLFIFSATAVCSSAFNGAETFYQNNDFSSALEKYQHYLEENPDSFNILYNIGNCYFKLQQYGKAIVYYKRALQLNPKDTDALKNLELTRQFLTVSIDDSDHFSIDFFQRLDVLSLNQLYVLFMILFVLLNTVVYFRLKGKKSEFLSNIMYSLLVLVTISGFVFYVKYMQLTQSEGVVVTKKVAVHSGPSLSLPELFFVHEGHEFIIKKELQDWVEIELKNGFQGWIGKKFILKI